MRTKSLQRICAISCVAITAGSGPAVLAQDGERSIGRGWPVLVDEAERVGSTLPFYRREIAAATNGDSPEGIEPLARDVFTSDDFYVDRALWSDPRYFRCNSPIAADAQWGGYSSAPRMIVGDDPSTGAWGHCDRDYPRESIVSPYGFDSAQAHYEALLAEAVSKGGPARHTRETIPDWNGRYGTPLAYYFEATFVENGEEPEIPPAWHEPPQWMIGDLNQIPTILSLLTEKYQTRFVQQVYHMVRSNAPQWSLMFCRPEGLMRWWSGPGQPGSLEVTAVPGQVQFRGGAGGAIRVVNVDREFTLESPVPRLGPDVPQWLGETIGFWDDDALITWTSNVQGWFTHGSWEHSDRLQTIEIWSPRYDADSRFIGLEHESIFYDPEALVQPVRDKRFFYRKGELTQSPAPNLYFCNQTIYPLDGRGTHLVPGRVIEYEIEDLYGRPWARIWERHFEQGMQRPIEEGSFFGL
jgi:hypothetical protein